jgi:hypothetical protein
MTRQTLWSPALVLALVACGDKVSQPTTSSAQSSPTMATGTAHYPLPGRPATSLPTAMAASDVPLTWDAPAAWEKLDLPNPMRKATYKIPRAAGDTEDAELTVTLAGGDVDSNVARWSSQFDGSPEPKREDRPMTGFKLTVVEIEGAFKGLSRPSGEAPQAKAGTKMLAAIADVDGALVFFKMTGPTKTVDAARADFDKLMSSLKRPA